MTYENLLEEAYHNKIHVIENAQFESRSDGLINDDVIAINKEIRSTKKRACVLAEELGHYYTSVGEIIDQSDPGHRKQEYRARIWAYNRLIGLDGIIKAHKYGCSSIYETAEFLCITEEFLLEAMTHYKEKYGICVEIDHFIIYFEPTVGVFELI